MRSPKRNVLKEVAPAVESVSKPVLPEQTHFNEETKEEAKSKTGPHKGPASHSV